MEICSKQFCTGCGMCSNICPKKAIHMEKDAKGFLYPVVNTDLCVCCNLCHEKCPANYHDSQSNEVLEVFAAWNNKRAVRKRSTSGGIFSLCAEEILRRGGVVFGVKWADDFSTVHYAVENIKELPLLYGSKYVQSNTNDVYTQVKRQLMLDKYVLFTGTPCQVAALKSFLGKHYEKLYTIDLVCHGVPSDDILKRHLSEITDGKIENIKNIYLRHKSPCWSFSSVKIDFKKGQGYQKATVEDPFFNLFNFNYSLRNSCHSCRYATDQREGDITLCDFWGFRPQNFRTIDFDKGVSGVVLNTKSGKELFECIKKDVMYEKRTLEELKRGNQCLYKPFDAPEDVSEFWEDYLRNTEVKQLNNKYIKRPYAVPKQLWFRRMKLQYKWILNKWK